MRWVLVVLVVVVLIGIWAATFFVPDLRWFAEALTGVAVGVPVIILLTVWGIEQYKRAREAKPKAPAEAKPATPIAPIGKYLRASMQELARVRGGRGAANRLPWYLALGTPGAGTSTMLDRLGLTALKPAVKADEPPSPFALWCSGDAVFVDASARLTDAAEKDNWQTLLRQIHRVRPHGSLSGIVLTIALSDLQSATDANLQDQAARLRARLDEVLDELGLVLPVYLAITKADLLPGFADFWANDATTVEESAWGASFPVTDDTAIHEPGKAVQREVGILGVALHARLVERLPQMGDGEPRVRFLRFPLEFRSIEGPLARFVDALCRKGPAPERFVLRGFYLTAAGEPRSKGVFLLDLLRSILLPDRNLPAPTAVAERRRTRTEALVSLIAFGVLILALAPALTSYAHNVELAHAAEAAAVTLANAGPESLPGMRGDPIDSALDILVRMEDEGHAFSIPGWFGPRAARELPDALSDAYISRIHAWLAHRVEADLEKRLDNIVWGPPLTDAPTTPDDRTPLLEAYETVKLCAALADPKGHANAEWAAKQLAGEWRKVLPSSGADDDARLTEHARRYLQGLEARPDLAWPLGSKLIEVRNRLKRLQVGDMAYRRLLLWAQNEPPVRASDIFGHASLEFLDSRGDVQVRGVFTSGGWRKIREALRSPAPWPASSVVESWVLDDSSIPADERGLRDQVRQRYFDDYADRWMHFLAEVRVKAPFDVDSARRELTAFKAEAFYKTLFSQLKLNTIHDDPDPLIAGADGGTWMSRIPWLAKSDPDAAAAAAAAAGPSAVERALKPMLVFAGESDEKAPGGTVPLDKYLAILDGLKADLGDSAPKSLDEFQSHLAQAKTGVNELLDGVSDPPRRTLAALLLPPVMGGVAAGAVAGQRGLSDDWKSIVWTAWDQKLRDHYPFKTGPSATPAVFADFAKFFRPDGDGIVWGFVHTRLATMVEQKGDGEYAPKAGADVLAPDALLCLTVAQDITDAFFHSGEDPGLKVSVQADWSQPDVTDAKFFVGAKDTALPKGTWSVPLRWFGDDVRVEWKESGRPTQALGRHSFSLFDLFTNLGGLKAAPGGRPLYSADCPPLTLKVRPEGKDAFRSDFFTRFHCPDSLRVVN